MKLSDIRGERVFDVIADIIDPIANIAESEHAAALLKRVKRAELPEGTDVRKLLTERLRACVPPLIREHKADVIKILAAIEGTDATAYTESLSLAKLMHDTAELMTDDAFIGLFFSAQSGSSSGSAQENTGAATV